MEERVYGLCRLCGKEILGEPIYNYIALPGYTEVYHSGCWKAKEVAERLNPPPMDAPKAREFEEDIWEW